MNRLNVNTNLNRLLNQKTIMMISMRILIILIPVIILVSILPIQCWRLRHIVAAKQMVIKSGDHDDHDDYD